jgi:hypothetical protein
MRTAALLLAAMLAGCAHTHSAVNASATTGSGTTAVGGSVSVHGHGNALAALVLAGMFMAAAADYSQNPYPPARFSDFADWFRGTPPPAPMDASRRVNEQDCTKPIDEAAGNLRCR